MHEAAFGRPVEARLTDELREDAGFLPHLSLVAVDGGGRVKKDSPAPHGSRARRGPLQEGRLGGRSGAGTALVHAVLAVAEACDERLVALLGAPAYYRRFGFVPASDLGVEAPDPRWGEHFQARRLTGAPVTGRFRYADPFDRV